HGLGDSHQRGIAGTGSDQRNGGLDQRQCQREHESVMADLYDHATRPFMTLLLLPRLVEGGMGSCRLPNVSSFPLLGEAGWGFTDAPRTPRQLPAKPRPALPKAGRKKRYRGLSSRTLPSNAPAS